MLVSCLEMQQLEKAAFARGVEASALMEEAGLGLARIVQETHWAPGRCIAFCGKGNNAGDALVALRHLRQWGWEIAVDLAYPVERFSPLPAEHYKALEFSQRSRASNVLVALDGLLGIGAQGAPRPEIASAIDRINRLRQNEGASVIAIDLPSGLDGDTGQPASSCVVADITATIAFAKRGLVADSATNFVGRLALIPLADLSPEKTSGPKIAVSSEIHAWLPPRPFDIHKGVCGRVGIIAGSMGLTGAARLSSAAAVAAGAGLVTLYAKEDIQPVLAASCVPEVMVKPVKSYEEVLAEPMDVLAIGPGMGSSSHTEILSLVQSWPKPMVVDADALNAVAKDPTLLQRCAGERLLTPHPGEMERLFPQNGRSRLEWLDAFLTEYPVHLLLKGSRTIIGAPSGERYYNTTGNPGMASGGMGDVLTGVCAGLVKQCDGDLLRSAVLGAWLCGRAAEFAASGPYQSPESLSARKVVEALGAAFGALHRQN
jgi:NAD(P)H-hydrate epimerase